jgi:hypothetical protein
MKKPKLGTGQRFATLSEQVAKQYISKGKSPAQAKKIGQAVAAIAGRAKYGTKKMSVLAKKGKA